MLEKTIKYTDFFGNEREEKFYFHLSTTDLTKLMVSKAGGFDKWLETIAAAKDGREIMNTFENIIRFSYGIISEDGRRFVKSPEISDEFMQTAAYDQLFQELISDPDKAVEFCNGAVPAEIREKMKEEAAKKAETESKAVETK